MTTKNLFIVILMAFATIASAQRKKAEQNDDGNVEFDDGTVINFKMLRDDPTVRTDWTITGSFEPSYFEQYLVMSMGFEASLNLWDIAELHGKTRGGLHIDLSMEDNPISNLSKQYQHHRLDASFKFYHHEREKKTPIILDQNTAGYLTTFYYVKGSVKRRSSYGVVAGIDYTQRRFRGGDIQPAVVDTNEFGMDNYSFVPATLYQTNLRLGLDVTWIASSLVEIDGFDRVDYQHYRLYSLVLLPVNQNAEVGKYYYDSSGIRHEVLADESEYTSNGLSSWGYLLGIELLNDMNVQGGYYGVTFEAGLLPGMKHDNLFDGFTASIAINVGFGTNLRKTFDKD